MYKKDEDGIGVKDENDKFVLDERNIITMVLGAEANKPQYVVHPPTNASLDYMKDDLKMYAIVTAVEDDVVPDLNFRHLSAIMRVTVHNHLAMAFIQQNWNLITLKLRLFIILHYISVLIRQPQIMA